MTNAALGIDVGSTNTKVAMISLEDTVLREVAIRSAPTPEDADALVTVVQRLVREAIDSAQVAPDVVGIASMAETGVPLNQDWAPITGLIRWNGARDRCAARTLFDRLGPGELFLATGVQPGRKAPLATWAWLRDARSDVWANLAHWAGVSDLIARALTGEFATDHTLAGRTMAYRLSEAGKALPATFDADLLAEVDLQPNRLPRVVTPGDAVGTVTADAAERTGLVQGTPVVIAGHDHAVGAWAAGVREPGDVADSVGTAEALVRVLGAAADRADVFATGMGLTRTVTGQYESLIAGSPSAGSLVRWWFEKYFDSTQPDAALSALHPHPSGLLVLPYLIGRQTPAPDPAARVRLCDTTGTILDAAGLDPVRLTKALFEGLALQVRWMDSEQRRIASGEASTAAMVVLGGPGAANTDALAIKSAVLGVPLLPVGAREPVASGAALLAADRILPGSTSGILPMKPLTGPGRFVADYDDIYAAFVAAAQR